MQGAFVLKLTAESAEHIDLQTRVHDAIAAGTPFATPKAVGRETLADGRIARLLRWVEGISFADAGRPKASALGIGVATGRIVQSLAELDGPAGGEWDLGNAADTIRRKASAINDRRRRDIVLDVAELVAGQDLEPLPRQVIHGDLNDDNLLLADNEVVGVIDAGDAMYSLRIAEPATAAAYMSLGQDDPLPVASDVIKGFVSVVAATAEEAQAIWSLVIGRLATSVVFAASGPRDNPHRIKSEDHAWEILERFAVEDTDHLREHLSSAAGHPPSRVRGRPPDAPPAR